MKPIESNPTQATTPIFIMGISQRSGTNFLSQLIRQHPECGAPTTIWENYFVYYSDLLMTYSQSVFKRWKWKTGSADRSLHAKLNQYIGNSLVEFLSCEITAERLVTKTPDVYNINNHFQLFPNSCLLILVRDGRAVVESRVKTFGESYQTAMRTWSTAAETILKFDKQQQGNDRKYLIVKYEDLWRDVEKELRKIFDFCDLDPDDYDFDLADKQPIRGSSIFHGEKHSEVHWEPVKKAEGFDPTKRWSHWGRSLHEQFNAISGGNMEDMGYTPKRYDSNGFSWKIFSLVLSLRNNLIYSFQSSLCLVKKTIKCLIGKENALRLRSLLQFNRS